METKKKRINKLLKDHGQKSHTMNTASSFLRLEAYRLLLEFKAVLSNSHSSVLETIKTSKWEVEELKPHPLITPSLLRDAP